MKFELTEKDVDTLQMLREATAAKVVSESLFSAEVLGLVEGSYRGHKGIGTGGGTNRRYQLTTQGFAFMARIDWLKQ